MRKAANKVKSKVQKDIGHRECQWVIYGCSERIPVPGPGPNPDHETICQFRCHPTVHSLWTKLRKFENENPRFKPNVSKLLALNAREFKPVELWVGGMDSCPKTEPWLFKASDVFQNGEPPAHLATPLAFSQGITPNTKIHPPQGDRQTSDQTAWWIESQIRFSKHSLEEVIHAIDLQPTKLFEEYPVGLPPALASQYSERVGYSAANATPRFTFVDMHVDRGMSTVSINLDKTQKIWLLWPPEDNEETFYTRFDVQVNDDEIFKLNRIAPHLKHGRIVYTDNTEALFIPAGWIHAVITLQGGLLMGYSWSAQEDIETLLRCFEWEAKMSRSVADVEECCNHLLECLELCMHSMDKNVVAKGVESWIKFIRIAKEASGRGTSWSREVVDSVKTLAQSIVQDRRIPLPSTCPCIPRPSERSISCRKHLATHVIPGSKQRIPASKQSAAKRGSKRPREPSSDSEAERHTGGGHKPRRL